MSAAEALFLNCKQSGQWNSPIAGQEKIMAMSAQLESLKASDKKLLKKKTGKQGGDILSTKKKGGFEFDLQPWMYAALTTGNENKVMMHNKKEERWCQKHLK